ncbi:HamA C-terminal domain-containing protein [Listeria innocua]|uniref:HamA C-terminal domain-containing protein n=1 Tax=Listeria innocua TaxID=1642 RepID=UPI00175E651A|nr:DUF1837 domain-containing protein [Listeria innocua]HAA9080219.1 hypothetical protein [Listeria monocytogenes]HAA9080619.1 hypothetical protein [Listeria monocytogenes]HBM3641156.1 DUF1837 domain-containing protein [Listeria innocua]
MKRLCFGTLMSILYQARNQKVTNNLLCDAIFSSYAQSIELRDGSLPGHLKSGRDNVPPDVIDAARNTSFEDAEKVFQTKVILLIKDSKRESVVRAIKDVLREDTTIQDHTVVGYINGYEKNNILINSTFSLSALLASVFYFAIIEVKNQECKDAIKGIDKKYVESFESSSEPVYFERAKADVHLPLQKTLHDPVFDRVFNQVSSLTISGLANPSNVKIYGVDVNNCKFKFKSLKEYLVDNIGSYVFSRAKANRYTSSGKSASIGAQALIRFMQAYGTCAETILGEMLLYVFMEQELNAPKIMSKIEIDDLGGMSCSKSDGVHLLAVENNGQLFHQLVFGASDIYGDLTASIDRAFDKIIDIENNSDIELKMVENTTHNNIYDPDTTNYMIDLLLPKKSNVPKPDMAYGVFLGYTLSLDYKETDNNKYRTAVKTQMQNDIVSLQPYIEKKIRDNGLSGYNFYLFVVPFNDAPTEKNSIISEMLSGRY